MKIKSKRLARSVKWVKASKVRFGVVLAVLFVLLYGGWRWYQGSRANTPQYQTEAATRGTLVSSVSASGQVLSANILGVTTQVTGVVNKVYVKNGADVSRGQRIAEITPDAQSQQKSLQSWAALVSARNALNSANNTYRSTQASVEKVHDDLKGHDADETFAQKETRTKAEVANDNAFDALRGAQANLVSASVAYQMVSPIIVAPAAGTLDNVTIVPGMVLAGSSDTTGTSSSNRVAIIKFSGNPIATFNLSEVDVAKVTPGQKATITFDSLTGKTFTGKVLTVDRTGVVASGVTNYPVIIGLDTDSDEILPNMAATANIILASKSNALMVPSEAVRTEGEQSTVQVLKDGKVETRVVTTGLTSETETEIISGLTEGEIVITGTAGRSVTGQGTGTSPFNTFRFGGAGGGTVRVNGGGGR